MRLKLSKSLTSVLILLIILSAAFISGIQFGPPVLEKTQPLFTAPIPTPTPDTRTPPRQFGSIGGLNMQINQATQIDQPNSTVNMLIVDITISAHDSCAIPAHAEGCTYYRNNFHLQNLQNQDQPASSPPLYYIPKFQLRQFPEQRRLGYRSSETGQLYFLLVDPQSEYTLTYTDAAGKSARFIVQPQQHPFK